MGSDVEGAAVIAPTAVASSFVYKNRTEVFAGRTDHEDTTGTTSPDVTLRVHFQPVASASATLPSRIEEGAAVGHCAVGLDVIGHNSRVSGVAHGNVERLLVMREGDAIRESEIGNEQGHFTSRINAKDAVVWQLLKGRIVEIGEAIRGIGEVYVAVLAGLLDRWAS